MVDATVINGKEYPVGNEPDTLKMPYRLMVRDEELGPVVHECSNTLQGIAYALGFELGFDTGWSEPASPERWVEVLNADTGKYEEVALELLEP